MNATNNGDKYAECANFDIKTELDEFEKDLSFLKFIQSDDVFNVEKFLNVSMHFRQFFSDFLTMFTEFANISSNLAGEISRGGDGGGRLIHGRRSLPLLLYGP